MNKTLLLFVALSCGSAAQAATVAQSLPYQGTPDWTDIVFSGTSMTTDGATSTLNTAISRGVWFGWGSGYSDPAPAWSPGTNAQGNHLSLTASFSDGATDWSAYLYDGGYNAFINFNSTYTHHGCTGNSGSCYNIDLTTEQQGVTVYHAEVNGRTSTFVPLNLSQVHTYEFLLKDAQVAYRIDGQVVYAGAANNPGSSTRLMVIGDGSGSSLTGRGSMTLYGAVSLDNAPVMNTLVTSVPEPEAWAMLLAGLGLVGWAARRRAR